MILFRHADPRFAFLWEDATQPEARWHGSGEGPAHYLADTPDGAWAEFIRHEGITDVADLATVRRAIWAIEIPDEPRARPTLPEATLRGGLSTYAPCQEEARRLRAGGANGIAAPSAALKPGTPSGWRVQSGLQPGGLRDEQIVVLFGLRANLVGWAACETGRPRDDLLARVSPLTP
jgi:RES domain.